VLSSWSVDAVFDINELIENLLDIIDVVTRVIVDSIGKFKNRIMKVVFWFRKRLVKPRSTGPPAIVVVSRDNSVEKSRSTRAAAGYSRQLRGYRHIAESFIKFLCKNPSLFSFGSPIFGLLFSVRIQHSPCAYARASCFFHNDTSAQKFISTKQK